MTDDDIQRLAAQFAQYADAKETTLRGDGITDFARALLALGRQEWRQECAKAMEG